MQNRNVSFLLLFLLIFSTSCVVSFRKSDKKLSREFATYYFQPRIERMVVNDKNIRFAEVGEDGKPVIFMIHGAPGSLSGSSRSFLNDSSLVKKAKVVSVDRPGYGYSDFGKPVVSIEEQAALLKPVLERYKDAPRRILVGSSYGGAIIARLAADYPDLVDGLVFVSASVAPGEEKIYKISYPIRRKAFQWMVPTMFRVANAEKLSHKEHLLQLEPLLENITVPATIIHGTADKLIYPSNADFIREKLTNATTETIIIPDMDHPLIWRRPDIVKEEILKHLNSSFDIVAVEEVEETVNEFFNSN